MKISHGGVYYDIKYPGQTIISNDKQSGSWGRINHSLSKDVISDDVFSLWIDHGKNPVDSSYAYVLSVPDLIRNINSLNLLKTHSLEVIENTSKVQAVYDKKNNVAGVVFYEHGSVKLSNNLKIGVDKPCLVLVNCMVQNNIMVSVSNPENKAMSVNVEIGIKQSSDTRPFLEESFGKIVTFNLPGGIYAGKSLSITIPGY